jgi:P-type E1-E2 ATPase
MLQEADVGVAIAGDRAELVADFVVPNFKAVWRLLFVHGRWNYIRTTELILYFFYKNLLFALP